MADLKITELTATTTLDDTDLLVIVDGADTTTKKITGANLKASIPSGGAAEDVEFTPAGNLAADDVQEALEELDSEKAAAAITLTAGNGLTGGGDLSANRSFAVNVDDSSIEINTDALRVKAGGITAAMVASDVATQAELDAHLNDTADAHDASAISIADAGDDFTATDVEGALAELQADHETDAQNLADHIADSSAAHAASAISVADSGGNYTATDAEAALAEVMDALQAHDTDTTNVHGITDTSGLYRSGGTDVALADGGTGASLADPGADRILFWDDSADAVKWLIVGTNLTITDETIAASGSGGGGSDYITNFLTMGA